MRNKVAIGFLCMCLLSALLLILAIPNATKAAGFSIGPATIYNDTYFDCVAGDDNNNLVMMYYLDGTNIGAPQDAEDTFCGNYIYSFSDLPAWLTNFMPGEYGLHHILVFPASAGSCNGSFDYATCYTSMEWVYESDITFVDGDEPPPDNYATSTIEQSQMNLALAVFMFHLSFFGMIWLLRKH